jgi:hypothetical protein
MSTSLLRNVFRGKNDWSGILLRESKQKLQKSQPYLSPEIKKAPYKFHAYFHTSYFSYEVNVNCNIFSQKSLVTTSNGWVNHQWMNIIFAEIYAVDRENRTPNYFCPVF